MDASFAESMVVCMRKSIVHSNLYEAALTSGAARRPGRHRNGSVHEQSTQGADRLHRSLSSGSEVDDEAQQRLYTRSLLSRFMSFVTHRPTLPEGSECTVIEGLEEVRRAIRLGVLCCELTKACLDNASDVLRDFSLGLSMLARKYLLLSAIKILDVRYVLRTFQHFAHVHAAIHMTRSHTFMHTIAGHFRCSVKAPA